MKKVLTLMLALVLVLSLVACGGNQVKSNITLSDLESKFDVTLQESAAENEYTGSEHCSTYVVKTDGSEYVNDIEITVSEIKPSILLSEDATIDLIDRAAADMEQLTISEIYTTYCITSVSFLRSLIDENYSGNLDDETVSGISELFTSGSEQFNDWTFTATVNSADESAVISAKLTK